MISPKKWRIKFVNTDGKKFRLTAKSPTDHLPVTSSKSRCILCDCNTTVSCSTCTVHLCKNAFGRNELSCFHKFHNQETVTKQKRTGDTYRRTPAVDGSVKKLGFKKIIQQQEKKTHPTRFRRRITVDENESDEDEVTDNDENGLLNSTIAATSDNAASKIMNEEPIDSSNKSLIETMKKYRQLRSYINSQSPKQTITDGNELEDSDSDKKPSATQLSKKRNANQFVTPKSNLRKRHKY